MTFRESWTSFRNNIFHLTLRWLSRKDKIAALCIFPKPSRRIFAKIFWAAKVHRLCSKLFYAETFFGIFLAESSVWKFSLKLSDAEISSPRYQFIIFLWRRNQGTRDCFWWRRNKSTVNVYLKEEIVRGIVYVKAWKLNFLGIVVH